MLLVVVERLCRSTARYKMFVFKGHLYHKVEGQGSGCGASRATRRRR